MSIVIPVVLSGGAGSRLWPVSRESHPKPFMVLGDGQSLLQKTYLRIGRLMEQLNQPAPGQPSVLTVTNREYYFMSKDELSKAGLQGEFLLEPFGRNTAGAIAIAAHAAIDSCEDAIVLVLPADHLIADEIEFASAVKRALKLAQAGYLVTFGMVPDRAETGFGYIKRGIPLDGGFAVDAFVEKPDYNTALTYVNSGGFLWNSGMFCFSAKVFFEQLSMHSPDVAAASSMVWKRSPRFSLGANSSGIEIPSEDFIKIPDISIDHALMECSERVAVVDAAFGWSDIGSWNAIQELVSPDEQGNRALGDAIFVNSSHTFVQTEDRLVAAVGVDNLLIIDTSDAILVATPQRAQDVKIAVELLKKLGHQSFKTHQTVFRPWGSYSVLEEGVGYKIKRIEVKSGASLSLQLHHHRSEHWIVVSGSAVVVNGDEELTIGKNQSTYIPAGTKHRLANQGDQLLVMIEVQCGEYLGEDDIVRLEDLYGRA